MQCDHLFEFLTKLGVIANKQNVIKVVQGRWVSIHSKLDRNQDEIQFDLLI